MAQSNGTTSPVPLDEVQGNVTPGFRKDHQAFLFLRFPGDPDAVRAWLARLLPGITSARQVATFNREYRRIKDRIRNQSGADTIDVSRFWRSTWVNAAFTAAGLRMLHPEIVDSILHPETGKPDDAFANGMCKRIDVLEEPPEDLTAFRVRDSIHPNEPGDRNVLEQKIAHALLIVGSDTPHDLAFEVGIQIELATGHGLTVISQMNGQTLGGGRDHFGFRDGISQPDPDDPLAGWTWRDPEFAGDGLEIPDSEQIAPPGLVIRGCETYRDDPFRPEPAEWERFGSYLVFRRFHQDVEGFKKSVDEAARVLHDVKGVRPMTPDLLMAQLVGRWPSGAKLVRPEGPNDENATKDPFPNESAKPPRGTITRDDYFEDRNGRACPMFAHVRVAFPRSVRDAKKHRIVRRGITYTELNGERGLLFAAYQSSIEQGFQFIQAKWLNRSTSPEVQELNPRPAQVAAAPLNGRAGAARPAEPNFLVRPTKGIDILTAIVDSTRLEVVAPVHPPADRKRAPGFRPLGEPQVANTDVGRLITIEGGGYFFSPSLSNMARLAGFQGPINPDPKAGLNS